MKPETERGSFFCGASSHVAKSSLLFQSHFPGGDGGEKRPTSAQIYFLSALQFLSCLSFANSAKFCAKNKSKQTSFFTASHHFFSRSSHDLDESTASLPPPFATPTFSDVGVEVDDDEDENWAKGGAFVGVGVPRTPILALAEQRITAPKLVPGTVGVAAAVPPRPLEAGSSACWKTALACMRFSMYWPNTEFSDLSLRFSSLTASTREVRSSSVFCNSRT